MSGVRATEEIALLAQHFPSNRREFYAVADAVSRSYDYADDAGKREQMKGEAKHTQDADEVSATLHGKTTVASASDARNENAEANDESRAVTEALRDLVYDAAVGTEAESAVSPAVEAAYGAGRRPDEATRDH